MSYVNKNYEKFDLDIIKNFIINSSPESKIYLGADSTRYSKIENGKKVWYARYAVSVIVHYDGKHGAKVFGDISVERDFDGKASRPHMRMMNEAMKVSEIYSKLEDILDGREVQIHLDINTNPEHGSSCAMKEALGYIKGMHNIEPVFKPYAFAASYCSDNILRKHS